MSLCDSIDTLAMAYLDDELAAEERHELEAHLTECTECRVHLDTSRADHDMLRTALQAPRASDSMKMRLRLSLDAADRDEARATRKRWSQYVLPGSAIMAAAAAILVFVGVGTQPPGQHVGTLAKAAVHQQSRSMPLEVQGASTGQWLRKHFEPTMEPPEVRGSQLLGARLGSALGHDAALLSYQVSIENQSYVLNMLKIHDVTNDEMSDGQEVQVGDRTMHVLLSDGHTAVTYLDANHMGYMFSAEGLPVDQLVTLVSKTSLVGPQ